MSLVLVSGVSGFIGAHVAKALLEKGYRVRGTVRSLKNPAKVEFLRNLPGAAERLELVEGDLTDSAEKWAALAQGCEFCCHVASPFPLAQPKNEDEVIRPALEGTRNVLKGCADAGVKSVVVTSSFAAIGYDNREDKVFNELDWMDPTTVESAYERSKILAERAAWEFQESLPEDKRFKLVTVNPTLVIGPVLSNNTSASQDILLNFLERKMPMVPDIAIPAVDVRDVALAHVVGLESAPNGQRLLMGNGNIRMLDMGHILSEEFSPLGYKIPTHKMPNAMLCTVGFCDKEAGVLSKRVGFVERIDNSVTRGILGFELRPLNQSLLDMGHAAVRVGLAHKTKQYIERYPDA